MWYRLRHIHDVIPAKAGIQQRALPVVRGSLRPHLAMRSEANSASS